MRPFAPLKPIACSMAAALMLAGCAEGPFIDRGTAVTVEKPQDSVLISGSVNICHADSTPLAEIEALAAEACARHGAQPVLTNSTRWQCAMNNPHRRTYACRVPGLVDERNKPINPADHKAVEAWKKRTGKTALPRAGAEAGADVAPAPAASPSATLPAPAAAPAAAPLAPLRPLSPADIAGRPAHAPAPLALPPAPAPAGPPLATGTPGFNLPVGSWGDAFQE